MTDFENSCLIVTLGLITNIINHFDVNFIIPISMSDENMARAHKRNAILDQKFWFNTNFVCSETYWQNDLHKSDFLSSGKQKTEPDY